MGSDRYENLSDCGNNQSLWTCMAEVIFAMVLVCGLGWLLTQDTPASPSTLWGITDICYYTRLKSNCLKVIRHAGAFLYLNFCSCNLNLPHGLVL